MDGWLGWLLGLREREVTDGTVTRLDVPGMPHGGAAWAAAAVVIVTCLLIVALYRRELELGRGKRILLAGLRIMALAVVVIMLLNPQLFTLIQLERRGQTFVLFDTSASMGEKDQLDGELRRDVEYATGLDLYRPESRLRLTTAAAEAQGFLEELEEKNRVRLFGFDTDLRAVPDLASLLVPSPTDDGTHIGSALKEALQEGGYDPIAGVVVFSDGRSTGGEKWPRVVGEYATRGIPVYTVVVGKRRLLKNIAVTKLVAPETAAIGFPIRIDSRIEAKGVTKKRTIHFQLKRRDARGGTSETIESGELELKGGELVEDLTFYDDELERQGTYHYVLEVENHRDETNRRDNRRLIKVVAAKEISRVLLLAGSPTFEYRFVKDFLTRDEGIQVSCWNSSADDDYPQEGDVVLERPPRGEGDLRPYDVVILLDPDAEDLTDRFLQGLKKLVVTQGTGLVYVAGENNPRPGAFEELAALLPVKFDSRGGWRRETYYDRPWVPELTAAGASHPVCRLADDDNENILLWQRLPPFYFAAAVPADHLRPAAVALLRHPDRGDIVAAAQIAGTGYSVYLGTDDLRNWRQVSYRYDLHERFWGAMVRYLASGKKRAGNKDGSLYVDRDRYDLGEEITVEASLMDSEKKPILKEQLVVSLEHTPRRLSPRARRAPGRPSGDAPSVREGAAAREKVPESLALQPVPERPGWYRGALTTSVAGYYSLESEAGAQASFEVLRLTAELEDPSPDVYTLRELAEQTGGLFVDLGELDRVARRLPDRTVKETVGRSASTLWDSPLFLFVLCGLLVTEWVLRKLWRLH